MAAVINFVETKEGFAVCAVGGLLLWKFVASPLITKYGKEFALPLMGSHDGWTMAFMIGALTPFALIMWYGRK